MNTNKRKAQSPLNTLLNISLESDIIDSDEIDKPLKASQQAHYVLYT